MEMQDMLCVALFIVYCISVISVIFYEALKYRIEVNTEMLKNEILELKSCMKDDGK